MKFSALDEMLSPVENTSPRKKPSGLDLQKLRLHSMHNRYKVLDKIGHGGFGEVWSAAPLPKALSELPAIAKGSIVAIKTVSTTFENIRDYNCLREVDFLKHVAPHTNLVTVFEMFVDRSVHHCHIVMEKMEMTLYQLLQQQENSLLNIETVRHLLFQMASGLYHIHSHGFIHRDIKPENILISRIPDSEYSFISSPLFSVKLADFGLSRHFNCTDPYTSYVSTRWYRAPEMILQSNYYSFAVDMWALGTVAYEVVHLRPLFPGNDALDQISRYTTFLGTPSNSSLGGSWPAYYDFMNKCNFAIPKCHGASVFDLAADAGLQSAIQACLQWDANKRISSLGFLYHKLFLYDEDCQDDPSCLDDYTFADSDSSNYCITQQGRMVPSNDFLCIPRYSSI